MRRFVSLNRADCSLLLAGIVLAILVGERPVATFGQEDKPAAKQEGESKQAEAKKDESKKDELKKEESTPAAAPPPVPEKPAEPAAEPDLLSRTELEERLEEEGSFAFVDVPLQDAVEAFGQQMHIQVSLDLKALDDEGVGADKPVTVQFAKLKASRFLDAMLEPLGLTWIAEDGYLSVTTISRAAEKSEIRVYQVSDLVPPNFFPQPMMMPGMGMPGMGSGGMGMPGMGGMPGMAPAPNNIPVPPAPVPTAPAPTNKAPGSEGGGGGGFFGVPTGVDLGIGQPPRSILAQFGSGMMSSGGMGGMGSMGGMAAGSGMSGNVDPSSLTHLVMGTVRPESWEDNGGTGSVQYVPGGLLVIRQSAPIHRDLKRFFAMLREARESEPGAVVTQ